MDDDFGIAPAAAYMVWVIDCECGTYITYQEDESTVPDACEECGGTVRKDAK